MKTTDYLLVEHKAIKAGLHFDLRIRLLDNRYYWASFVFPKGYIPTSSKEKVLVIRTNDHHTSQIFTPEIPEGQYGAGTMKKLEQGKCDVIIWSSNHIAITFRGRRLNGTYHFIKVPDGKTKTGEKYWFFKSKNHIGD